MSSLFVGLMSGTSLDGADAAVVDFSARKPRTLGFATADFPRELRDRIMTLSQPGADSIELAARVSIELAEIYARAAKAALSSARVSRELIKAIGCHGQTVRHRPDRGFTVQLNDPARLAELTGVDVVADFRRRDMAAGGQGAPLVPAFHEAVFRDPGHNRAIVNIGGISNVTWLPAGGRTHGFDCGPGNVLLDGWANKHIGTLFDKDGKWAAGGRIDDALLARLLSEPFLAMAPPKSTGRELFDLTWLNDRLAANHQPADVQATLADFTAHAIVGALDRFCPGTHQVYLAGGGARNAFLVGRIKALAKGRTVDITDSLGVPTGQVEPIAFAWLAMKFTNRQPVDLTAITGARAPRILGALYPA